MKKSVLKDYAKLIVNVGANVQKGQEVLITAEMDQPEFVSYVAEAAYKAGAKNVTVDWKCDALTKLNAKYQKLNVLSKVEAWEEAKLQHMVDTLPARIYIMSEGEIKGEKLVADATQENIMQLATMREEN